MATDGLGGTQMPDSLVGIRLLAAALAFNPDMAEARGFPLWLASGTAESKDLWELWELCLDFGGSLLACSLRSLRSVIE